MSPPSPRRPRVLVVDDDPDTRWMTAEALRGDYDVVTTGRSAEALARAAEHPLDAIVVDLSLGRESGWDVVRSMQADAALRPVPVIVLSAHRTAEPPAGVAPCAAYLTKPCPMARLREVLARLVSTGTGRPSRAPESL